MMAIRSIHTSPALCCLLRFQQVGKPHGPWLQVTDCLELGGMVWELVEPRFVTDVVAPHSSWDRAVYVGGIGRRLLILLLSVSGGGRGEMEEVCREAVIRIKTR